MQRTRSARRSYVILIVAFVVLCKFVTLIPSPRALHESFSNLLGRSEEANQLVVAFYTIPKPFSNARSQQERAIASWNLLPLNVAINLVLSADSNVQEFQEVASKYGANLINVRQDPEGNVLQDALFTAASRNTDADVVVVINSDIVLFDDFATALQVVDNEFPSSFFFVGARRDIVASDDINATSVYDRAYFDALRNSELAANAILHSYGGVDFYAWRPGGDPYTAAIGGSIPPFTYGRGKADNWVVKQAENNGVPVIDGSLSVTSLHFTHGYSKGASDAGGKDVLASGADGQLSYKNHWFLAKGDAVDLNKFSFFEFGNVKIQQGVPWAARWKLGLCRANGTRYPCLEERIGSQCDCEYNPYFKNTLSPVLIDGPNKICGKLSPSTSSKHPDESRGTLLMAQWRAKNKDLIILGFNSEYIDMLRSTICRFRQLGVDNYLAVAFNQEALTLCRAEGIPCVSGFSGNFAAIQAGAEFGSTAFRSLTKLKSKSVLQFLEAGFNVLWSDIDIFWFENVLDQLRSKRYAQYDVLIQSNAPQTEVEENGFRRINSGFYYVKSNPAGIEGFKQIVAHAQASRLSEQPSFYTIMCADDMKYVKGINECHNTEIDLKTFFLPRTDYPNGNTTLWKDIQFPDHYPTNLQILHNNWIAGHDAKVNRFVKAGFFQYGPQGCLGF